MTRILVMVVACLVLVGNLCAQDDAAAKRKAAQDKRAKMAQEQFKKLDRDGDGVVCLEEFKARRKGKAQEQAGELFKLLDKDGNGTVCCEEFTKKSVEYRFKMADKDGDGTLTFEEFKGRRTKPEDIEKAEQQFKKMDKDGDKKVCCEEFAAAQKKPARKPGKKGAGRKGKKKE